jgi:hypothetical protein
VGEHAETVDAIAFNASSTFLATGDLSGRVVCTLVEARECKLRV